MLFGEIVYGPIRSRRLGVSLGIELMPLDHKLCTFDCVYCECGFNQPISHPLLPTRQEVAQALSDKLQSLSREGVHIDVLTFSGNGEPTLHPDFSGIIEDTCALRDRWYPQAQVSVLSNATQLGRPDVTEALRRCDKRILKLDSATDTMMRRIDRPVRPDLTVAQIEEQLSRFEGDFILQTCFLRGEYKGETIDNTTSEELAAWYAAVERLRPAQVMIYVIDRATPVQNLQKIPRSEMERIAAPLQAKGIDVLITA